MYCTIYVTCPVDVESCWDMRGNWCQSAVTAGYRMTEDSLELWSRHETCRCFWCLNSSPCSLLIALPLAMSDHSLRPLCPCTRWPPDVHICAICDLHAKCVLKVRNMSATHSFLLQATLSKQRVRKMVHIVKHCSGRTIQLDGRAEIEQLI